MGWLNKVKELTLTESEMIFDCQFHPTQHNILACVTVEGDLFMLDTDNLSRPISLHLPKHHKGSPIRKLAFTSDHNVVTAAKTIKITDLNTGQVVRKISSSSSVSSEGSSSSKSKIYSLLVVDQYLLCAGDDEGRFRAWDYRVDRGTFIDIKECDDYLSDLDIDSAKKIVVASSGEGTLSAFNIRARRLEEPQSELFDAGFQCVSYFEDRGKVAVGAEDGAVNIFNIGQWGNISDRYPIKTGQGRMKGSCSIDHMHSIQSKYAVIGCSDGKLRLLSILPNKIVAIGEEHSSSIESLTFNEQNNQIASTDCNFIMIHQFEEQNDQDRPSTSASSSFFSEL